MDARELPAPLRALLPVAIVVAGGALIWLAFGHGFANYDTFYSLLWGNELAGGTLARRSRAGVRAPALGA